MKLLVLTDGKPGHYNPTLGIVKAVEYLADENIEIETLRVDIKSKFKREMLKLILNIFPSVLSIKSMFYFYDSFKIPKKPDIIISSGGNTSFLNAYLKINFKCKNIFNGSLRNLNNNLFDIVFSFTPLGFDNNIVLDLPSNTIIKEQLELKGKEFLKQHSVSKSCYSVLIGGNGSGYEYSSFEIKTLLKQVVELAKNNDKLVLITTSRRSGEQIDKVVRDFKSDNIVYKVVWSQKQEKVIQSFLGASEKIFVTEESGTMLAEAVASAKEVYAVSPKKINIDKKYKKVLEKFENEEFICRFKVSESIPEFIVRNEIKDSYLEIAQKIKESKFLDEYISRK